MKNDEATPMHEHPQYLHGQILALRALLLTLARLTTDQDSFREGGLQALELMRTALLSEPVADAQLNAIDTTEAWLREVS